ncbi:unnamed protein product, partial [Heterosigma akashiwo]
MGIFRFLAGGVAASIATTLTCPLEVIKIRLQSSNAIGLSPATVAKQIMSESGAEGFLKGLNAFLVGIVPNRAVYFWSYSSSKDVLVPFLGNTPLTHLFSAVAAGLSSNTITNPIWVVKTRLQLQADGSKGQLAFKGWRDAADWIARNEGLEGFYRGLSASYWGVAEACIQFTTYEFIKKRLKEHNARVHEAETGEALDPDSIPLQTGQYMLVAAAAKLVANLSTYPYMVARTRMREQATRGVFKYQDVEHPGRGRREEGMAGLYRDGDPPGPALHTQALMFLSYELI